MRREYLYYLFFLIIFFISALALWPSRWINIDVGSFHYHKYWQRPDPHYLSDGQIANDFSLRWGKFFVGTKEFTVVVDGEQEEVSKAQVDVAVEILRKRFLRAGFVHATAWAEKVGDQYIVHVSVPRGDLSEEDFGRLITQRGSLELWGEKDQQDVPADGEQPTTIRGILEQSYEQLDIGTFQIKGFKVVDEEEVVSLRLGLEDAVSDSITENVQLFYNKMIISVLDEAVLPLDGQDLGEQLSTYGVVRSIQIPGFETQQQAKITGAVIEYHSMPISLNVTETNEVPGYFSLASVRQAFLIYTVMISILVAAGIILYRLDGLITAFAFGVYLLLFMVILKILTIAITFGALVLILVFVALSSMLCVSLLQAAAAGNVNLRAYLYTEAGRIFAGRIERLVILLLLISGILLLFGHASLRSIGVITFVSSGLLWLNLNIILRMILDMIYDLRGK